MDKEQRPKQRSSRFAAGVAPLPGGAAPTLSLFYYVLDAILDLSYLVYTHYLGIQSVPAEGKLCCFTTSLACPIPTWDVGVQVMSRKTSAPPISGGSTVIFHKAGNCKQRKQIHLPISR